MNIFNDEIILFDGLLKNRSPWQVLAREVHGFFENGIPVTGKVLRYMDTTLGHSDPEAMFRSLLQNPDGSGDALLDLLFTPDEGVRIRIEPLLQAHAFEGPEEDRVLEHLRSACRSVCLIFPDASRRSMCLDMPEPGLRRFISGLHLCRQISPELKTAIFANIDPKIVMLVLVKLRLSPTEATTPFISFLKGFFEKMPSGHPLFITCLDMSLGRQTMLYASKDPYRDLLLLKERNETILNQYAAMETILRDQSMEIRMLQGHRLPANHPETHTAQIRCIDAILRFVFERMDARGALSDGQESTPRVPDFQMPEP